MNVLKSTLDSGLPKKISVCTLDAGSPTPYFQCYVNIIVTCIAEWKMTTFITKFCF